MSDPLDLKALRALDLVTEHETRDYFDDPIECLSVAQETGLAALPALLNLVEEACSVIETLDTSDPYCPGCTDDPLPEPPKPLPVLCDVHAFLAKVKR